MSLVVVEAVTLKQANTSNFVQNMINIENISAKYQVRRSVCSILAKKCT